jgi:Coenzyme PQQ synthesis protein D (PqqD)
MPKLSRNLRTTYTADGAVVLDVARGRIFRFNPIGSQILSMLERGLEKGEIVSTLIREFSADALTAESDTGEFLTTLISHSLVEP